MANRILGRMAVAAVLVAGIAAAPAFARDTDPHQHGMDPHRHGMMDWDAIDTNHDGKISAAEHAPHAKAMFERMDMTTTA